ncbi:DUF6752 domain-containing protein [Nocardioides limicola]|uniref:DUF6752 domain-containing protein n=1 Tax=Nocardioides limicola TaxID=2803368 RepID=UPI00193BF923|nr:DUF6752 domain-containing protein [Nocardioides sp. DJM-14]
MTERVFLHVGAPKSGTTYLQNVLALNREKLAAAGIAVVGERHLDRVHAGMVVREDRRLADLPPAAAEAWGRLVAQIRRWQGPTAVLSYELFAGASADQAARALSDLSGLEVHVVITARDFARAVPSAWQERLKFALTTPLEEWRPKGEKAGPRAEWGWRTMDPAKVAARWGATLPPDRVHVITMPKSKAHRDELWHRFAAACGIDVPGLEMNVERTNESLGVVAAEVLRRVNVAVGDRLVGNREQARWLRDTLAHGVLAGLDSESIGATDEQVADAARRSRRAIRAITEAGYDVRGELGDLEASRPGGRTPGQVSDSEIAELAVRALAELLLRQAAEADEAPVPRRSPRQAARGLVSRATAGLVDRRATALEEKARDLEGQLAELRALQLRVADLSDLVRELLLPAAKADSKVTGAALRRYRQESV